jgi:hypothetical protein
MKPSPSARGARLFALTTACLLAAACGAPSGGGGVAAPPAADRADWRRAPEVREVVQAPGGWAVRGQAAPRARVALSAGADAFAASADDAGAFEILIRPASQPRRLALETREGQAAARTPWVLLLPAAGSAAPPLLGAPGRPSRVFAGAGLVEAVDADSDPTGRIVSGVAAPGDALTLEPGRQAAADGAGRWSAAAPGSGPITVRSGARSVTVAPQFPTLDPGRDLRIEPAAGGWGYAWRLPDGRARTAWTPGRAAGADAPGASR